MKSLTGISQRFDKFTKARSRCQKCFVIKGVLRNFAKFTGNTCARVSFLKNSRVEKAISFCL